MSGHAGWRDLSDYPRLTGLLAALGIPWNTDPRAEFIRVAGIGAIAFLLCLVLYLGGTAVRLAKFVLGFLAVLAAASAGLAWFVQHDAVAPLGWILLASLVAFAALYLGGTVVYLVQVVLLFPVWEEVVFRWFLTCVIFWLMNHMPVTIYCLGRGQCAPPPLDDWARPVVASGVIFALAHLLGGATKASSFSAPIAARVLGEGLFLGIFGGMLYARLRFEYHACLLDVMWILWFLHTVVNLVAVTYNWLVNVPLSVLGPAYQRRLHYGPRLFFTFICGMYAVIYWYSNSLVPNLDAHRFPPW
jgi:hypothetical protein